jgi:hypothetical protein
MESPNRNLLSEINKYLGVQEEGRMRQVSKSVSNQYGGSKAAQKGKKQKLMDLIKEYKKNKEIYDDYYKLMNEGNLDTAAANEAASIVIFFISQRIASKSQIRRFVKDNFTIDEIMSLPNDVQKLLEEEI